MKDFSVLMSVYIRENHLYLDEALESVYSNTLLPREVILMEDGPLTDELYYVIEKYKSKYPSLKVIKIEENKGLTNALNIGISHAKCSLIARMDSDDICHKDRFLKQVSVLNSQEDLIMLGTNISEFVNDRDDIRSTKIMPASTSDIRKYSKLRNPFNHPSTMFRKEYILEVGGYREFPLFEDYDLWLRLLKNYPSHSFINLNEELLSMRTVEDLYKRRGGYSYIGKILKFRLNSLKEKNISLFGFMRVTSAQFIVAIMPNGLRRVVYRNYLRKVREN